MKNKITGSQGEGIASKFLTDLGFKILERNYRYKRAEIDIIAGNSELMIFIEVKTRTNLMFGNPETFVNENQIRNIVEAAEHYLYENDWKGNIRFDIISIYWKPNPQITHFKDAFH